MRQKENSTFSIFLSFAPHAIGSCFPFLLRKMKEKGIHSWKRRTIRTAFQIYRKNEILPAGRILMR